MCLVVIHATSPTQFSHMGLCITLTQEDPLASPLQTSRTQPPLLPSTIVTLSSEIPQNSFLINNILPRCSFLPHIPLPLSLINTQSLCPGTHEFLNAAFWRSIHCCGGMMAWSSACSLGSQAPAMCADLGPYPSTHSRSRSFQISQVWSTNTLGQHANLGLSLSHAGTQHMERSPGLLCLR